jgi:hypothetical protein
MTGALPRGERERPEPFPLVALSPVDAFMTQ